jgi:hypothetical protein
VNRMLLLSGRKAHVSRRHTSPWRMSAGQNRSRTRSMLVWSIIWTIKTAAETKTIYSISRGIPNLRCFWQNLSIARLKAFKACPPSRKVALTAII